MKPIVTVPNTVLTTPTAKVDTIDRAIKKLIADMSETLINTTNPKGVGLAAPQIGASLQIFLLRPEETDPIDVFINPEIVWKSEKMVKGIPKSEHHIEGCLSIPNVWGTVARHLSIKVSYMTESGLQKTETFSDFPSIIIQHEIDHLSGILFTRRVIEQKGTLYKPGVDDEGKEILEPIEL